MCGIWGIIRKNNSISDENAWKIVNDLMVMSEIRGKDATGLSVFNGSGLSSFRRNMTSKEIWKSEDFKVFLNNNHTLARDCMLIGHSRLITNGNRASDNQPVIRGNCSMVHNGIITNVEKLWNNHPEIKRELDVDTEVILALYEEYSKTALPGISGLKSVMRKVYEEIEGMASTLTIDADNAALMAASNNGSMYYWQNKNADIIILASERLFVKRIINKYFRQMYLSDRIGIKQLNYGDIRCWKIDSSACDDISNEIDDIVEPGFNNEFQVKTTDYHRFDIDFDKIKKIKRCSKCLLPETMPFIKFDSEGECNYCKVYKKQEYLSNDQFEKEIKRLKSNDKKHGTMVSFSGGRDSSFGLHYFVKEMGLKPIAYCYDWGMVTDLARRNQSRMCSKLGIELVLVAADIKRKRENIKKNVEAWMKSPDLGMVPIFMAGDKQYFYYANKVGKEYKVSDILLATNPFEKTYFKTGFAGIKPVILSGQKDLVNERLPVAGVANIFKYYGSQYIHNNAYINASLIDTLTASVSFYIIPHNYFRLFDYIEWNESAIDKVLLEEYDWEKAPDTETTWRIGDGTAPFYNYIYCKVAGFTENDTLRSNQVREGVITREEGLELIYRDNMPRYESMQWYFDTIGIDMGDALTVVSNMKTLY